MKRVKIVIIIVIIIVIALSTYLILNIHNEEDLIYEGTVENVNTEPQIVTNDSDFFTVVACVNKFLSYWSNGDKDTIYNMLDEVYIKENNITKENILNKMGTLSGYYTFKGRKMYYKETDNPYILEFYTYGTIIEDNLKTISQTRKEQKYYINIILDYENMTFKVMPSNEKNFPNS